MNNLILLTFFWVVIYLLYQLKKLKQINNQLNLENNYLQLKYLGDKNLFNIILHNFQQPLLSLKLFLNVIKLNKTDLDNNLFEKINFNIIDLEDNIKYYLKNNQQELDENERLFKINELFKKLELKFHDSAQHKGLWILFKESNKVINQKYKILELIISNYVENAIKYTSSGGVLIVYRNQKNRIEVRDSGIGISQEKQLSIFNSKFNKSKDLDPGFGQGLYLVKKMADLAGLEIGFKSNQKGSLFWVSI